MTGQWSKFKDLDESIKGQVKLGDGSVVHIKGKGSILFQCKNGEQMQLHEVYYIPSLCNNIISLGQLSEDGNRVVLHGAFLWIHDKSGRLLMKVERSSNRLYKIMLETCKPACLMGSIAEPAWLWHARLGHVNFQTIKMMFEKEMAHGVPRIDLPTQLCEGCLAAKQTRSSFPAQATYRAEKPLQLVHADLCGVPLHHTRPLATGISSSWSMTIVG